MASFTTFEELDCWNAARELKLFTSNFLKTLPGDEKYLLVSQMKRASRSVTANIAEGFGRFHFQENIQFCREARGSVHELKDHYITCADEGYVSDNTLKAANILIEKTLGLLNGYINYLIKAKENSKTPSEGEKKKKTNNQ